MIPYEELERVLTRWKARRSGAVLGDASDGAAVVEAESAQVLAEDADKTPPPGTLNATPFESRDSTGELELSDAEVDEAQ